MGAWQEIVDYTVPSNTTSVVLDNFGTITKDDFVKIVISKTSAAASNGYMTLMANAETTATNYHSQTLTGENVSVLAFRTNYNAIEFSQTSDTSNIFCMLKLSENDRLNTFSNYNHGQDATRQFQTGFIYGTSSGATFPSGITSITLTYSQANGFGTGSRIQIYKLAAEKVADITVASNTTQVDISNLSIDKDSEYLLVSDYNGAPGTFDLCINDDTTVSNYWYQFIQGNGSTANAVRSNRPSILYADNARGMAYTHIKLSNIGAYTYQSYGNLYSSSSIRVLNYFGSSTAENITSITKLNIRSENANSILTGTRFILYKLY